MNVRAPQTAAAWRGRGLQVTLSKRLRFEAGPIPPWDDAAPIRSELFSVERLEEHARALASAQMVALRERKGEPLSRRLADNETMLVTAYRAIASEVEVGAAITPAAEWLIDNFHLVEKQIREIRADLPDGYYRQLPKLIDGPFARYPRVFGIAWAFVAHTDSLFDPEVLRRFLRAYQEVQPLTIGEIWAVAITLRIVLVENLRRIAKRVMDSQAGRRDANNLADRLLGVAGRRAEPADHVLPEAQKILSASYLVQLVYRLRDQGSEMAPVAAWLDSRFAAQGVGADTVVRQEHQSQVAGSITVRNIITSMRLISDVDWREMFEKVSSVDEVFAHGCDFAGMDFATRNLYRNAVEELARGSDLAELDVARAAVEFAARPRAPDVPHTDDRMADPGYYLIARGRPYFESEIGFRPPATAWLARTARAMGIGGYVGAGFSVAALLLAIPLTLMSRAGIHAGWLAVLASLGLVPALDLAIMLVNCTVTWRFRATLLPALDLEGGIPANLRTFVAVPMMLSSRAEIIALIDRLEVHFLASPGGELHFALLSDWGDSETAHAENDDGLLSIALAGIERLNRKYGAAPAGSRFLLLHRRRVWNRSEGCWMGWERKRGKLSELNHLLRGALDTTYLDPPAVPQGVRYVITLDADTRLPRETIARLIGKMAHPLNRPRIDPLLRRVVEGHAVLQPRVTPSLPVSGVGSPFLRIFSTATGIDPYAAAVSDVYQDLFGEGSYTGKGIYEVDAFEAAMRDRVPDSSLLSHDLFEGIFARAGLASDVEVVEEFPGRYDVAALRHHRWARGDWQLLPWLVGLASRGAGSRSGASVPAMGRWKMIDNLRRSISPIAVVAALIAGWTLPFAAAAVWTLFVLATISLPPLIPVIQQIFAHRPGVTLASDVRALATDLRLSLARVGLMIVFQAHQACLMSDAIARTLIRLAITRRRLLQWVTAAQATSARHADLAAFYRQMYGAVVVGAAAMLAAVIAGRASWPLALPFVLAWIVSPAIALWVSRSPPIAARQSLSEPDATALRLIARQTWRFFETFVGPATRHLPPDNFQETPAPVLARRTSPTNMGLYLMSTVAARDFGWIGDAEAMQRLEATLETMTTMKRCRGHFYNWYDTSDLRPLEPEYVSSVDSGNLAGHLIAVANACADWRRNPIARSRQISGVADALAVALLVLRQRVSSPVADITTRRFVDEAGRLQVSLREAARADEETSELRKSIFQQAALVADIARALAIDEATPEGADVQFWADAACSCLAGHGRDVDPQLDRRLRAVEDRARAMALAMDFAFLLDPDRLLLSIGYQVREGTLDPSCYDLLASEARLASFFAIAKGDAPARHWYRLSHAVTPVCEGAALISWSGSMFEYLMPSLVIRAPLESLIEQTNRLIVQRQIAYGGELGTPWGVSESAYNTRDLEFTYQYSNFGVPGLGLKRGLANNAVIAPYATGLAAMIDPKAAVRNYERLETMGARGRYGFYEALDFTPSRVPDGDQLAVVRSFMAHHQGMTIAAVADALLDGLMRDRFHAEPIVRATELLLQEQVPRDVTATPPTVSDPTSLARIRDIAGSDAWRVASPWSGTPTTQLLSNGRYSVMITAAGSGYSRWRDLAVTRWREDATCDDWGSYLFLRDVATGQVWSATYQPAGVASEPQQVTFNEDRAVFERRDAGLQTTLDVLVSAEDDAEVRRLTILNLTDRPREIEVTSYAELVLAPQTADAAHPAFSKMFVETEYLTAAGAILATRRRRTPSETAVWVAHLAVVDGQTIGRREFETDRARFLGPGGTLRMPAAMNGRPLTCATGTVLDPILSLRRTLSIAPGATARIDFWTMLSETREAALGLVDKHHDIGAFERAGASAWTQAQVQLYHLGIDRGAAGLFQRLAGHAIFAAPVLRPPSEIISMGSSGQTGLWSLGISGDLPIILVRISDESQIEVLHQSLQAFEYWRTKRLAVDLVILNQLATSYGQDLQAALETLVRASQARPQTGEESLPGQIHMLRADLIGPVACALLASVARVVLVGERGGLSDQLERTREPRPLVRNPPKARRSISELQVQRPRTDLEFFNGIGGFAEGGREYVVTLGPGQSTPAPWINVISNPGFGFQVSAEGAGYAWSVNSREHQLTPWSNDPVSDRSGQVIYLRDEVTGEVWSPTASPIRDPGATYVARHGWGYSHFSHTSHGIAAELLEFVPLEDPIKISRLTLRNETSRPRRLSLTAYVEWVLGSSRPAMSPFVTTRIDPQTGAMLAGNRWNPAFAGRVAFVDLSGMQTAWTGDRREFIGRNGALTMPAALVGSKGLSGRVGSGLDPCAAMQTVIDLPPRGDVVINIFLGDTPDEAAAIALIRRYRAADLDAVLSEVAGFWTEVTSAVQVRTPDRSMDVMLNGWLVYQTLVCRLWARSAFYQAGGAYGFRDQLQDVMALAAIRPEMTREHLVRAAGRQFPEGDVQHWWLPQTGQGVRTRNSDDRLWLPYAAAHYIRVTGDTGVLDALASFLGGPLLNADQDDSFFQPTVSEQTASLYEHCARAMDASLTVGVHGMPLIGGGDWNDGMNRVGAEGRGESVWLGWFLHKVLEDFAPLAEARGDRARVTIWRAHMPELAAAFEREAWDGDWYKRGWFDDGSPLGSSANEECRIDSIAQAWSVLSGVARPDRAIAAMAAVERELILPQEGLALLFAPPFDRTPKDPGYIKGYPPGLRENGGQYTHAALWSVMAMAALGEGDKAAALFSLLNPINHARTRTDMHRYKVEPYVVAADVYAAPGHIGRGGWTWYTGSSGWMQRAGLESILGLRVEGRMLHLDPCVPGDWPGFEAVLRRGAARYEIIVENPRGIQRGIRHAELDGVTVPDRPLKIPLIDDGEVHRLRVELG